LSYDRFLPPKRFRDINDYFLDAASELARFESESSEELLESETLESEYSDNDGVESDEEGDACSDDELLSVH